MGHKWVSIMECGGLAQAPIGFKTACDVSFLYHGMVRVSCGNDT